MHELLYDKPSIAIALALLASMVLTIEVTYRVGLRRKRHERDAYTEHINAVQAALLGVLALVLGFTFSIALQRYDSRSESVVGEANAIGTTYLRARNLVPSVRGDVQRLLREYVDVRVAEGALSTVGHPEHVALAARSKELLASVWDLAVRAVAEDPQEVTSGYFVESLNAMIDAAGSRDAATDRHVPELVILLLFVTFVMACTSIGFAAGIQGYRPSVVTYTMVTLIVVLVYLIVDIDRPRRGMVVISQKPMTSLQASMRGDAGVPAPRR